MKLLLPQEARSRLKKEEEILIGSVGRLRKQEQAATTRLQSARANYDPEIAKALKDYEFFLKDISAKKQKALKELLAVEQQLEERKEFLYGLVEKADELNEQEYQLNERENKLDLRENLIKELERKWNTNAKNG